MLGLKTETKSDLAKHIALIVLIVVLLIVTFFNVVLPLITRSGQQVRMPDFTGKTVEEARQMIAQTELEIIVNDSAFRSGLPGGVILFQNPGAGSIVKPGRKVYLTTNLTTPQEVILPDIRSKSLREAQALLAAEEIGVSDISRVPGEFEDMVVDVYYKGKVLRAGDLVTKGSNVALVVSFVSAAEEADEQ